MRHVKVSRLRQDLPAYLAKVARGERVRVTLRGKAIAEIVPACRGRNRDRGGARPPARQRAAL